MLWKALQVTLSRHPKLSFKELFSTKNDFATVLQSRLGEYTANLDALHLHLFTISLLHIKLSLFSFDRLSSSSSSPSSSRICIAPITEKKEHRCYSKKLGIKNYYKT